MSNAQHYLTYKESARKLAQNRIEHYNKAYGFRVNRISIKNNKSRWGSCSIKGNLNFNYHIALLPAELADYVVVHELCHLGELNHSRDFWKLVAKVLPEYRKLKQRFKGLRIAQVQSLFVNTVAPSPVLVSVENQ